MAPTELSPKAGQAKQALAASTLSSAEKHSAAQNAWLRFVEKVERGELVDPSGQYVAKGTQMPVDASAHRASRPKFDAATPAFAQHFGLRNGNGKDLVVTPSLTSPDQPPCDGCEGGSPPITTTFISSEGTAPYSGADNPDGYIWDLKIGHGSAQGDHYGIPNAYTVLYSDLNKGAGGPFIYIGFTRVPGDASINPEVIQNRPSNTGPLIQLSYVTKCCFTSDYQPIITPYYPVWVDTGRPNAFDQYDLNQDVGGTYIHASQSKNVDSSPSGLPIEIGVLSGNSSSIQPPTGWTKLPLDLNEGAGGNYIYFCTKTR